MIKVLFVTSEAAPFVSTGGLGDVSGSLPRAINRTGKAEVRVVVPMYRSVKERYFNQTELLYEGEATLAWRRQYLGVRTIEKDGVRYYFLDNEYYFGRESEYGNYDDGERFAFFGRAVCEMIEKIGFLPDVLHANDWQSALSVVYLKRRFPSYSSVRCIFTVHNIEYQGKYDPATAGDVFGLSDEEREIMTEAGALNLMKGAIVFCDALTTVSPRYAEELKDPYFSCGLGGVISSKPGGIRGILNGIDTARYDPYRDRAIPVRYSKNTIQKKRENRDALLNRFGLTRDDGRPVVSVVSRLVPHKGIDLIVRVVDELLYEGTVRFVLLGTGYREYEAFFSELPTRHPGDAGVAICYDSALASLIYAGSDLFLMPSRCEPCGLSQMIAQRYGTPPIVRETGGLSDTVEPYDEYRKTGTGFSFRNYNAHEMKNTVSYAVSVYRNKADFTDLVKRCMALDNSWVNSAGKYVSLYERVTSGE